MKKVAIVYWSGTGNTQAMAEEAAKSAQAAGADATLFTASAFSASRLDEFDAIGFGCPAMGAEVLEESEFEPLFAECEPKLKGKKIALFGSYDWGDGEWMRLWNERCETAGAVLAAGSVIANNAPDAAALASCRILGAALAAA
ncbi:MAG: flavodoxin [Treponema sp.]|jgi:flavodoxin short chain|nr:flavodoxin [Treponema sp.]